MKKVKLSIPGIHCDACRKLIEMEVEEKGGKAIVDVRKKTADVEYEEKRVKLEWIQDALKELGYESKVVK